ncbi:MAG: serine hydrolase domain-containing protein [Bacteroidota bacterium]
MIQTLVEEEQIVGLAITVSLEDSVMWSEGFGYSDLDKEKPIKPDQTLFRIASLSKPLTATILGRLEEEELIDSKASVYTYVPDFPTKAYDFNLWHLATHRSGIRHYKAFEKDNQKPLSMEEGLAKFQKSKLKFEPGTDYLYSSYGYNLLGVAMVQATNTSFPQLLQTYVTTPLGMKHTVPDTGVYDAIQTSGFFKSNGKGKVEEAKSVNYTMKMPSGGLLSTSEDLVTFGNAYVYQRLLRRKTQEEMLTDHPLPNGEKTGYGMGWGLGVDGQGRQILSHTGGNVGSVCKLIVYPESALTLAVVSNTYGIDWLKFIRTVNRIPNMILEEKEDQVKLSKK